MHRLVLSLCLQAPAVLLLAGCSSDFQATTGPGAHVHNLTGAHTRIVWVQGDGTDPEGAGDKLILMGFDSQDGRGERVILGQRGRYTEPKLTPRASRVLFSRSAPPAPPEIFIVNWDGSGARKLADGFALTVWEDPNDGSEWVYAGTDAHDWHFATVTRFPIDAPERRELVWNTTLVSSEGFQVTPDGRRAGGMFPYPSTGIADLTKKTWTKLGEGCWTSLSHVRGPLFWYFDGAHRNVTMVDVDAGSRWMVNINDAPGFEGAEVNHPRWTNHPRFLTITGPYNQGGPNQARAGGRQTEVYLGRFSADFSKVEAWVRVTNNAWGDSLPYAWIDAARSPYQRQPSGPIGPPNVAPGAAGGAQERSDVGRLVLNVRLTRPGPIPNPTAILPYRSALTVNEYDVLDVIAGKEAGRTIRIAQWVIRDGRVIAGAHRLAGTASTLTVERYDAHAELEGERLISDSEASSLPLYYDIGRR
jgi:hypothetical protein